MHDGDYRMPETHGYHSPQSLGFNGILAVTLDQSDDRPGIKIAARLMDLARNILLMYALYNKNTIRGLMRQGNNLPHIILGRVFEIAPMDQ